MLTSLPSQFLVSRKFCFHKENVSIVTKVLRHESFCVTKVLLLLRHESLVSRKFLRLVNLEFLLCLVMHVVNDGSPQLLNVTITGQQLMVKADM